MGKVKQRESVVDQLSSNVSEDEHEPEIECNICEDILDEEIEEIEVDDLNDFMHTDALSAIAPASTIVTSDPPSMNTRSKLLSRASTTYSYPAGIEFVPESKKLMKGKNLLLCTSLGWTDGSSPSASSVESSGKGCARNAAEVSYGRLQTDVRAKKINTNMAKEANNVGPASELAKQSWRPIPQGYDKVRYAMFNGGVGGNNRYGLGTLRMRQLTVGVVEHEYYHGEGLQHSNRWRPLRPGEKKERRETYKLINGVWHIFESSRDGFSTMSIYGTQKKLTVPQMEQVAYEFKQLALYHIGKPSITYNLQDVMAAKRDGVVNGVKIMLEGGDTPFYLGRYTSKIKIDNNDEISTVLAFHTATGENGMGSTRWMLGAKGLYFSDIGVYAKVVNNSDRDVWQVEVGRIAKEAATDVVANKRVKMTL